MKLLLCVALVLIASFGTYGYGQAGAPVTSAQPGVSRAASSARIDLDMVVDDASGKPVPDLEPFDFSLLDRDQTRKILAFRRTDGTTGNRFDPPVEVIIILDAVNLPYQAVTLQRQEVEKFLQRNGGHLAQPVSIFVYSSQGLHVQPAPSKDGNALSKMLDQSTGTVRARDLSGGVYSLMEQFQDSFNTINGVPASANPFTLTQVLRKEWGFGGFVVSDWGAVAELLNHGIGADDAAVARKALEAGVDMDMEGVYGKTLAAEVRSGRIPQSVVNEAVRRILRVKYALGLFDHPYTELGAPYRATDEKRAVARKIADETMVLLKNDSVNGAEPLLPLKVNGKKVALIGPMADDSLDLLGAWSGQGNPKDVITLKADLAKRVGDRMLYAEGCGLLSGEDANVLKSLRFGGSASAAANGPVPDDAKTIAEAVETAKQADVAILALGEPTNWMEGEAASRVHLGFTGNQEKLLQAVVATGKPVVLVVLAGRPLQLKWAAEHVPAILEAWSPGMEAGPAVDDVLFGDVNPSGKLPSSFPRAVGQEPLYYAQLPTGRPAHGDLSHMPWNSEEKFVSRYMDEENSALFPFGWGLSYTKFSFSTPTLSKTEVPVGQIVNGRGPVTMVSADVTNAGNVPGTEVVQFYVRDTVASVSQPVRELKGFTRVDLKPGETKRVQFPLGFEQLSFYNVQMKQTVEPAIFDVWIGDSSLATAETSFIVAP